MTETDELVPRSRRIAQTLARRDPFWPAQLTVLAAIALSLDLPSSLTVPGKVWLIPAVEGLLLAGLVLSTPWVPVHRHRQRRKIALSLVALVSASNFVNLGLLVHKVLHPGHLSSAGLGRQLIVAGVEIWITNVLLFTVWYWELDRGGPMARRTDAPDAPDFYFPQMSDEHLGGMEWRASYIDYMYTSFTNATAFSPTDTMPLTPIAKLLMGAQSLASLITIGMVFARAVNILQ